MYGESGFIFVIVAVCLDSKKDSYNKINYFLLFSAIFFYFSSTTLSPKNLDNPNGSSILFQTQNPFFFLGKHFVLLACQPNNLKHDFDFN